MKGTIGITNNIRSTAIGDFTGNSFLYADEPHSIIRKDTLAVTCFNLSTSTVLTLSRDTKIIPVDIEIIVS